MTKFYDLSFNRQSDGSIRLTQSDCGEDCIIDLHPSQLRYIAESFGLIEPSYAPNELSKRLAEQLCTIQKELATEHHRSPWLEQTYIKLDAWCSALPDNIFPYHLWDDDEQLERANRASNQSTAPASQS